MNSETQLRKEPRFACSGLVNVFEVMEGGRTTSRGSGLVEDISRSGASIQVDRALRIGVELVLRNRSVNARAVVRNIHRTETGFTAGVEFLDGFEWTPESDVVETALTPAPHSEPRPDPPKPVTPAAVAPAPPVLRVNEDRPSVPPPPPKSLSAVQALLAQIRHVNGRLWSRLGLRDDPDAKPADCVRPGAAGDPLAAFAFDQSPTKAVVLDGDLNIVFANSAFTRTFGSDRLLADRSFRQFVDPEDLERINDCHLTARNRPGIVNEVEFVALVPQDRQRVVFARWRHAGASGQSVLNLYDVTDQRREERDLLSTFFGSESQAPDVGIASWNWDVATKTVRCSREYAALYGLPPSTARIDRQTWINIIHPDDRQRVDSVVDEMLAQTGMIRAEFRIVRPDGSIVWLVSRGHLVYDRDGRPTDVVGETLNITARKETEQKLKECSSRFALAQGAVCALMSASSAGQVLIAASDARVVACNEAARRILGCAEGAGPFPAGVIFLDPQGKPYPDDRLPSVRCLRTGEGVTNEPVIVRRPREADVQVLVSATPIPGAVGPLAVLLTLTGG